MEFGNGNRGIERGFSLPVLLRLPSQRTSSIRLSLLLTVIGLWIFTPFCFGASTPESRKVAKKHVWEREDKPDPVVGALVQLYSKSLLGESEEELSSLTQNVVPEIIRQFEKLVEASESNALAQEVKYDPIQDFRSRLRTYINQHTQAIPKNFTFEQAFAQARGAAPSLPPTPEMQPLQNFLDQKTLRYVFKLEEERNPLDFRREPVPFNKQFTAWLKKTLADISTKVYSHHLKVLQYQTSLYPEVQFFLQDSINWEHIPLKKEELSLLIPTLDDHHFAKGTPTYKREGTKGPPQVLLMRESPKAHLSREILREKIVSKLSLSDPENALKLVHLITLQEKAQSSLDRLLFSMKDSSPYPLKTLEAAMKMQTIPEEVPFSLLDSFEKASLRAALSDPTTWKNRYQFYERLGILLPLLSTAISIGHGIQDTAHTVLQMASQVKPALMGWGNGLLRAQNFRMRNVPGVRSEDKQENQPRARQWDSSKLIKSAASTAISTAILWSARDYLPYIAATVAAVGTTWAAKHLLLPKKSSAIPFMKYKKGEGALPAVLEYPLLSDLHQYPFEVRKIPETFDGPSSASLETLIPLQPLDEKIVPLSRGLAQNLRSLKVSNNAMTLRQGEHYDVLYVPKRDSYFIRLNTYSPSIKFIAQLDPYEPPERSTNQGVTVLGSTEVLKPLADEYTRLGFSALAEEAHRRMKGGGEITTGELRNLLSSKNRYTFESQVGLDNLPLKDLEPYKLFQDEGRVEGMCTVGNGFGSASTNTILKNTSSDLRAEVRTVYPVELNGDVGTIGHVRSYLYGEKDLADIVDFTPPVDPKVKPWVWPWSKRHRFAKKLPVPTAKNEHRAYETEEETYRHWVKANQERVKELEAELHVIKKGISHSGKLNPDDPLVSLIKYTQLAKEAMRPEATAQDIAAKLRTRFGTEMAADTGFFQVSSEIIKGMELQAERIEKFYKNGKALRPPAGFSHYAPMKVQGEVVEPMRNIASTFHTAADQMKASLGACQRVFEQLQ